MAGHTKPTDELYPTGPIEGMLKQVYKLQTFRDKSKRKFNELTHREMEVLALIAEGLNNPAIAKKLNISRITVQNHRAAIRDKLEIKNHTGYIKYAIANDLIKF